ncbi:MAG TPA: YIP1 family protein [Pyrinomonadaceae bacterium]|nr:YIP1 family protein [Pyrinomonadaceae bacterium]
MSAPQDYDFQAPPPPPTPDAEPQAPRPTKQLWPMAIGVFVIGVILLAGGFAGFIAGGRGAGAALCFLGVLWFALGFIRLPLVPNPEPPLSWFDRVTGIFFEPSRVFRNLRSNPNWLAAFLVVWVLTAIYSTAFIQRITPQRIVDHTVEKTVQSFSIPPEVAEKMRSDQIEAYTNPVARVSSVLQSGVGIFAFTVIAAALCFLGILVLGGRINFWQALAAIIYAALPVVVIHKVLGLVILYLKSPDDLHPILNQDTTLQDNLSILLSPGEQPVLFVIAAFFGLTSFYGLWLRAKGLHLAATRATSGAGWGVSITLFLLTMLLLASFTALFPQFIS